MHTLSRPSRLIFVQMTHIITVCRARSKRYTQKGVEGIRGGAHTTMCADSFVRCLLVQQWGLLATPAQTPRGWTYPLTSAEQKYYMHIVGNSSFNSYSDYATVLVTGAFAPRMGGGIIMFVWRWEKDITAAWLSKSSLTQYYGHGPRWRFYPLRLIFVHLCTNRAPMCADEFITAVVSTSSPTDYHTRDSWVRIMHREIATCTLSNRQIYSPSPNNDDHSAWIYPYPNNNYTRWFIRGRAIPAPRDWVFTYLRPVLPQHLLDGKWGYRFNSTLEACEELISKTTARVPSEMVFNDPVYAMPFALYPADIRAK